MVSKFFGIILLFLLNSILSSCNVVQNFTVAPVTPGRISQEERKHVVGQVLPGPPEICRSRHSRVARFPDATETTVPTLPSPGVNSGESNQDQAIKLIVKDLQESRADAAEQRFLKLWDSEARQKEIVQIVRNVYARNIIIVPNILKFADILLLPESSLVMLHLYEEMTRNGHLRDPMIFRLLPTVNSILRRYAALHDRNVQMEELKTNLLENIEQVNQDLSASIQAGRFGKIKEAAQSPGSLNLQIDRIVTLAYNNTLSNYDQLMKMENYLEYYCETALFYKSLIKNMKVSHQGEVQWTQLAAAVNDLCTDSEAKFPAKSEFCDSLPSVFGSKIMTNLLKTNL